MVKSEAARKFNLIVAIGVPAGLSILCLIAYVMGLRFRSLDLLFALGVFLMLSLLILTGLGILGFSLYHILVGSVPKSPSLEWSLIPILLGVMFFRPAIRMATRAGELRDINRYGVETLRRDAKTLLSERKGGALVGRYNDNGNMPKSIRELSGGEVELFPDGVRVTTGGFGPGRSSGFYIFAEGAELPGENSAFREIVPGIYNW